MSVVEFKSRRCEVNEYGLWPRDLTALSEEYGQGWEVVGMTALPPGGSVLILLKRPVPTEVEVVV